MLCRYSNPYCQSSSDMVIYVNDEKYPGVYSAKDKWQYGDCFDKLWRFDIPSYITRIDDYCFNGCDELVSLTLPEGLKEIGDECFHGIRVSELKIPSTVTQFGKECFSDCYKLRSINIPNGITKITQMCFRFCSSLTSITIPDSVLEIDSYAFGHCSSLKSITLPSSISSIGSDCFWGCNRLTSINIPSNVVKIGKNIFSGSELNSIIVECKIIKLGSKKFKINEFTKKDKDNNDLILVDDVDFNYKPSMFKVILNYEGITRYYPAIIQEREDPEEIEAHKQEVEKLRREQNINEIFNRMFKQKFICESENESENESESEYINFKNKFETLIQAYKNVSQKYPCLFKEFEKKVLRLDPNFKFE